MATARPVLHICRMIHLGFRACICGRGVAKVSLQNAPHFRSSLDESQHLSKCWQASNDFWPLKCSAVVEEIIARLIKMLISETFIALGINQMTLHEHIVIMIAQNKTRSWGKVQWLNEPEHAEKRHQTWV